MNYQKKKNHFSPCQVNIALLMRYVTAYKYTQTCRKANLEFIKCWAHLSQKSAINSWPQNYTLQSRQQHLHGINQFEFTTIRVNTVLCSYSPKYITWGQRERRTFPTILLIKDTPCFQNINCLQQQKMIHHTHKSKRLWCNVTMYPF